MRQHTRKNALSAKVLLCTIERTERLRGEFYRPIDHQLEIYILGVPLAQYVMPSAAKVASSIRPVAGICFTSW
jgi:hypothetical protein